MLKSDCIPCSCLHSHVQSLQAAMGKKAVERGRDSPHSILNETKFCVKVFSISAHHTHNNVRMPSNVLRDRMHNQVGTKRQRGLKVWRTKRVVNSKQDVSLFSLYCYCSNIRDFHGWICRRFQPSQLRIVVKRNLAFRVKTMEVYVNAHTRADDTTKVPLRASIDIIDAQNMVSKLK